MENTENIFSQSAAPDKTQAVNVNTVDTSVLKNEFVKKTMEKSENICGQSAAPEKAMESDKKMNENETDLDKQHKKKLEVSKAPTSGNFRCDICNVEATDQIGLKIHLAGKKHIMKVAQADSVVNVEKSENVCSQLAAPNMAKENDQKINESELDLDKKHKLEMPQAKVIF